VVFEYHFEFEERMSALGHERRLKHLAATSAITLNADIRLRCTM
jgi:hypothetical protein